MKLLGRLILPLMLLIITLATGGAYAVFSYQNQPPNDLMASSNITLSDFEFSPEEVLPGGSGSGGTGGTSGEPVQVGENHMELINNILNHMSYGLNATAKPIIHTVLNANGKVIYCDQNVQGGNLKHLAIDKSDNAQKLYFVIHRISATEYHTFTMLASEVDAPISTWIEVYKTIMIKNDEGKWIYTYSHKGKAQVFDPGSIVDQAIDVNTYQDAH